MKDKIRFVLMGIVTVIGVAVLWIITKLGGKESWKR